MLLGTRGNLGEMLREEIRVKKKEEGYQPKNVNKEKLALGEGQGTEAKDDLGPYQMSLPLRSTK